MRRYSPMLDRLVPIAALVSTLALLAAVLYFADASNVYWERRVLVDVLYWAGSCVLGAGILRYFLPAHAAVYFVSAVLIYLAVGAGLVQSAAAVLLILSWYGYGRAILGLMFPKQDNAATGTQCILVGLALYLAIFGIMIHYRINYRALYFAITLVPLLVVYCSGKLPAYWNSFLQHLLAQAGALALPYSFIVLLTILFALLFRLAFLPTLSFDDNALHLGIWHELSYRHILEFDVVTQVWSVAPFAVDLLQAILSMLAGEDARAALNVVLLVFLLRQLWVILGRLSLSHGDRLLLLLLFISTPIVGIQFISLQTEWLMAALVASGVRLVLEAEDGWYSRNSAAILAVAAICCAVKLPGVCIGALVALAAITKLMFTRPRIPPAVTLGRAMFAATFVGMLAIVAFNAYFTAWRITGNPVFPLYNAIFQSPFYEAANFVDDRWLKGFSFISYLKVFFTTSEFFEARDFTAGFQYLFLLPLGVIALWRRTSPLTAAIVLLPLCGFGLLMFSLLQYWRYLFPVFPLAIVVIGGMLIRTPSENTGSLTAARLAIVVGMGLNAYFYPGISVLLGIPPTSAYTQNQKQTLIDTYAPVRAINMYLNRNAPGMTVLYPQEIPFGATLDGQPVYVNVYSPSVMARAEQIKTEAEVVAFLNDQQVDFVISFMADGSKSGNPKWLLREYLSHAAFPEYKIGDYILYRLLDHDMSYEEVFTLGKGDVKSMGGSETPQTSPALPMVARSTLATEAPVLLAVVQTGAARSARYRASFNCPVNSGYFVAQVNWNTGPVYYHLLPCADGIVNFAEAFPVPAGATEAGIYISSRNTPAITLNSLTLEIN
jgi:hypothetical protein